MGLTSRAVWQCNHCGRIKSTGDWSLPRGWTVVRLWRVGAGEDKHFCERWECQDAAREVTTHAHAVPVRPG